MSDGVSRMPKPSNAFDNYFSKMAREVPDWIVSVSSVRLSLLGIGHLEGDGVGGRLVDVDKAHQYRCLVVGTPDDHLEVAFGDPAEETVRP